MKLTDRHTDKMALQPLDEGDSLGLYVKYKDSVSGVDSSLGVTLDEHAQEMLLREWMAIRLHQMGHTTLARGLRRAPADLELMEKLLVRVGVELLEVTK